MKSKTSMGIMLTVLFTSMLTLAFNTQQVKASEPSGLIVRVTVDKPFPQPYRYGETMHIRFILINPLPQPKEILFVWYSLLLYPPVPWITHVSTTGYTIPAETVKIYEYTVPLALGFPLWALWIVVIQDPLTMETIGVIYILWSYTP